MTGGTRLIGLEDFAENCSLVGRIGPNSNGQLSAVLTQITFFEILPAGHGVALSMPQG
jgi:hypothetical protein